MNENLAPPSMPGLVDSLSGLDGLVLTQLKMDGAPEIVLDAWNNFMRELSAWKGKKDAPK